MTHRTHGQVYRAGTAAAPRLRGRIDTRSASERAGAALSLGFVATFITVVVALPIAALAWAAAKKGSGGFWDAVTNPEAMAALKLTLAIAALAALFNAVLGTITAWVLVRDDFRGKTLVNAVIDLPFALPTIVAGLLLLTFYGPRSPVGVHLAFTRGAIFIALLFVTLPFVVRTVQPVLIELDQEMEEAARSLGANELTTFRRIVLPNILPGILSGVTMAFARAVGEIGAIVLISGNLPYRTEMASVFVFLRIQSGDPSGAAAVAIVLLTISFAVLLIVGGVRRFATRHERSLDGAQRRRRLRRRRERG
jgi:sulfate transport system permease protein